MKMLHSNVQGWREWFNRFWHTFTIDGFEDHVITWKILVMKSTTLYGHYDYNMLSKYIHLGISRG